VQNLHSRTILGTTIAPSAHVCCVATLSGVTETLACVAGRARWKQKVSLESCRWLCSDAVGTAVGLSGSHRKCFLTIAPITQHSASVIDLLPKDQSVLAPADSHGTGEQSRAGFGNWRSLIARFRKSSTPKPRERMYTLDYVVPRMTNERRFSSGSIVTRELVMSFLLTNTAYRLIFQEKQYVGSSTGR